MIDNYIPLVENQKKHTEFVKTVPSVKTVILKINHAKTLLQNKGITAEKYAGPATTVITTTTIDDRLLEDLTWEEELGIVKEFNPDCHIPADCPTYRSQDPKHRQKNLDLYLQGVIWLEERLSSVQLLPLIKGESKVERQRVKYIMNYFGYTSAVYYVTQYMTTGKSPRRVVGKINQVANEFRHKDIIVMGLQAPQYVEKLDSNIVAVSGQRWLRECLIGKNSEKEIISSYTQLANQISNSLGENNQKSLFNYTNGAEA